ncbi:matrix metalloproteinase-14 isoform X3 [Aethina tumida]|uniref:matrix metalloproteinase-14 isoform X3 n=1 Tax=Aethina tumida TaxID=116153 RepID=UPI0021476388|nr:matrix metalloproteinase-14 isoform X3 [Aethina tumida]XP_049821862.1 matrix metalloproteinase-14 isoform X3 [Aethina tumida]
MRAGVLVCFAFVCLLPAVFTAPADNVLLYLQSFGYIDKKRTASDHQDIVDVTKAIKEFQSFAGLDVTGVADNETLKLMGTPRCGVPDKIGTKEKDGRQKRYALQGSRWKVKNLTYRISKYPRKLDKKDVDKEIYRAFSVWSEYTDLTFTPSNGQVHIDIRFESGEHGDGDPFDGPGGTLAHAYFPVYGGDAHFDASEQWSINSYRGTNLFQVAAHEFGHSLGLSHSDVREALMAPFYRGYDPIFQLDSDDIQGIQALYGKKTKKTPTPSFDDDDDIDDIDHEGNTPTVTKTNVPDQSLCKDPKFDTIFNSAEGYTYIFKGDKYWRLTDESVAPGYPKSISQGWPGLPGNIDAAFTYKNGKTYFFKGSKYWRYKGRKMDGIYPKEISEGFTGIPDDVDAALVWSGNGKIYFYKGSKFWRFDPTQRPPVKSTYPKLIANWEGVPNNLDAAFQWTNGYTYFYKDNAYYRFNDRAFAVDAVDPAFPRSTAYWWFGCKEAPKGTIGSKRWGALTNEESGPDPNENEFTVGRFLRKMSNWKWNHSRKLQETPYSLE